MKARPILFSAPMIRALLAGTKTQTRRVVKARPDKDMGPRCVLQPHEIAGEVNGGNYRNCPYGQPGDLLWVRESITIRDKAKGGLHFHEPQYRADFTDPYGLCFTTDDGPRYVEQLRWTPSIHMPRAASRLTLCITEVRVERLQDIAVEDAEDEGCKAPHERVIAMGCAASPTLFFELWDSINGVGAAAANPWVFALTFEVIKANVDTVLP